MEAAGQPRGLAHYMPGNISPDNRNQDILNAQHHATYR
jgi:hypothetical protein